jgi:sulfate adenylyltransferase subunit 2
MLAGGFFVFGAGAKGNELMTQITIEETERRDRAAADQMQSIADAGRLSHLRKLEAESIYILREAVAEFSHPVMMYSIGKDSSVMLRLAQKAFHPGKIPFPLLHIDTSYKFPEMISFRDSYAKEIGAQLIVHRNEEALRAGANPFALGTQKCCGLLKTKSLLDALSEGGFNAAFGGARRDEEKSRAKERIYSFRDAHGQWDPKNQRPELWNLFNSRIDKSESIRVFPLSNWTELDVWLYILAESIPIVPLYYAKEREVVLRNGSLVVIHDRSELQFGEEPRLVKCRMRSLGCVPCTGAIRSEADTLPKIIEEMISFRRSERENRAIDHDEEGSMELKKREGYF